ncbi:2,3-diaminopropionate biosynthesis protein SbnB [Actinokineospora xionganensis]|uniref:2,3-diaminopropionate biosynthesis protein SbnB n=1 Tax=Actinokineospora xionganensis TaxID=2684470 RepID=A0ABR7LBU7_9PSEU|nr:2,3-diaminopropionate biosynthesis protein SbnB [Actinokineospora xionganensis]MBC6450165.1 2,3-diaminopropionate biosynthesis protein SbnB [Actinokineospora xionganensis]
MLIVGNDAVRQVLDGNEHAVLDAVRSAYRGHELGRSALPHSVFLRFPDDARNRIIGLPAYLGGDDGGVAGMKWVASFPGNVAAGLQRASATIVLNSMATGQPVAFLEGSTISARRTAASAALAAATLRPSTEDTGLAVVGCGLINFEVLRFVRAVCPSLREVTVFDLDPRRAAEFALRCDADLEVRVVERIEDAVAAHRLVSLATTASTPHLDLGAFAPGTLVLHVSLRDITIDGVLSAVNIVDDTDHVCRAATSLHLAEQHVGNRDFVSSSIGELLLTDTEHARDPEKVTLFSPFGLGVLDLAVADLVLREARAAGLGFDLPGFLPHPEPVTTNA